jgi:ketosteroid isomerase-like protein
MDTSLLQPLDATLLQHFVAGDPDAEAKPREKANVACAGRLFGAIVTDNFEAVIDELAEDVQVDLFSPPEFPFVRQAAGREAARAMILHNFSVLTDQQPEILGVTAQGDTMVLVAREVGRIRHSDLPYAVHFVYQINFVDGKAAKIVQYATPSSWANASTFR